MESWLLGFKGAIIYGTYPFMSIPSFLLIWFKNSQRRTLVVRSGVSSESVTITPMTHGDREEIEFEVEYTDYVEEELSIGQPGLLWLCAVELFMQEIGYNPDCLSMEMDQFHFILFSSPSVCADHCNFGLFSYYYHRPLERSYN